MMISMTQSIKRNKRRKLTMNGNFVSSEATETEDIIT